MMKCYTYKWLNFLTGDSGGGQLVCTYTHLLEEMNARTRKNVTKGLVYWTTENGGKVSNVKH